MESTALTKEKVSGVANALADFVIHAAKQGATPEQVEALPKVAALLMPYCFASELSNLDIS